MPNHLIKENSPYLLQHAENPVEWYPWGPEALEKARSEDKPIFLSIGYAACHWCHVMAHESFEDPAVAAIVNEHFVSVKVDREERPDLDGIYMQAVVAMTGQGGWPMSVFLTPDGQPFFGGTYFPPVRRYNLSSFRQVVETIARLWRDDRPRLLRSAQDIAQHIKDAQSLELNSRPLDAHSLEQAAFRLAQSYDWQDGGWGQAPKFPQPMSIEFLLLRATQGDQMALDIACHALDAMSKGGMYDVVGGGFARYSTDNQWLTPHFEKMLYDNAQLASAYLHAYLITRRELYRRICEETLDFMVREMMIGPQQSTTLPFGGFYSSLDADSEGEEGKYYLWTPDEISAALSESAHEIAQKWPGLDPTAFILAAYNVRDGGNFDGRTILQRDRDDESLSERFNISAQTIPELLKCLHSYMLRFRQQRVRPAVDDKILTAWNGLALVVFAEAARYLNRSDYLEIARENAHFLLSELRRDGRLWRSWRRKPGDDTGNGQARHVAYLEDYASLILGLLALYQSEPDVRWYSEAEQLVRDMLAYYRDENGGFFDTSADQPALLVRPKDLQDNATPSGSALASMALIQLSMLSGEGALRDEAESVLEPIQDVAVRYPLMFSKWLCAIDLAANPSFEIAILGDPHHPNFLELSDSLWSKYRPHCMFAASAYPPEPGSPPLLLDRSLLHDLPTAYVCQQFTCQRPVTTVQDFLAQITSD